MPDSDTDPPPVPPPLEPAAAETYSIEAVMRITEASRHQIGVYYRHGLVSPVHAPEREGWWFDDEAIRLLRRLEHLRVERGVNLAGLRVISELSIEVEKLRDEVRGLRRL